jgi:ribonuclease P protein component
MLPKENRLILKSDFDQVKNKGLKFQSNFFGLLVYPTSSQFSRFGFLISTRLSKRAVKRNLARRRLRQIIRELLPDINPGFDVVFLGKKALLETNQDEVEQEVKRVFKKARLR